MEVWAETERGTGAAEGVLGKQDVWDTNREDSLGGDINLRNGAKDLGYWKEVTQEHRAKDRTRGTGRRGIHIRHTHTS